MSLFSDALVAFPAWGAWVDSHYSNDAGSKIGVNALVLGAVPFGNETPYSGTDVEASMEVVWNSVAGTSEMDAGVHIRKGANGRAIAAIHFHNAGTSFLLETRAADESLIHSQSIAVSGNLVLGDYYRIYVGALGSNISARCQHLADGKWLTPAGAWSAVNQYCATQTASPVIGSGTTGMEFFAYGGGSNLQIRNFVVEPMGLIEGAARTPLVSGPRARAAAQDLTRVELLAPAPQTLDAASVLSTALFFMHEHRLYASVGGHTYCWDFLLEKDAGWTDCGYGYVSAAATASRFGLPFCLFLVNQVEEPLIGARGTGIRWTREGMVSAHVGAESLWGLRVRFRGFDFRSPWLPGQPREKRKWCRRFTLWGEMTVLTPGVVGTISAETDNGWREEYNIFALPGISPPLYPEPDMLVQQEFSPNMVGRIIEVEIRLDPTKVKDVAFADYMPEYISEDAGGQQ